MKHIELFNEHLNEINGSPSGPTHHGNTGTAGGFTGPVSFHAQGNISGQAPIVGTSDTTDIQNDMADEISKTKLKQSFANDEKGKRRKRPEEDLFGKSKRRIGKLTAHMKKGSDKGIFTDEKDKISMHKEKGGNIKSFSDFAKD